MRLSLRPHPDTPSPAVRRLEVGVGWESDGKLLLHYLLEGDIAELCVPAPAPSARADRLWEHSCFEAFLRPKGHDSYFEFNFAPSTEWAAYRLRAYRSGMTDLEIDPPNIDSSATGDRIELRVQLDLVNLPAPPVWQLGLSAVVEDAAGTRSFWALAHAPGEPDFHHSDCFAIELAAAA